MPCRNCAYIVSSNKLHKRFGQSNRINPTGQQISQVFRKHSLKNVRVSSETGDLEVDLWEFFHQRHLAAVSEGLVWSSFLSRSQVCREPMELWAPAEPPEPGWASGSGTCPFPIPWLWRGSSAALTPRVCEPLQLSRSWQPFWLGAAAAVLQADVIFLCGFFPLN